MKSAFMTEEESRVEQLRAFEKLFNGNALRKLFSRPVLSHEEVEKALQGSGLAKNSPEAETLMREFLNKEVRYSYDTAEPDFFTLKEVFQGKERGYVLELSCSRI